MPSLDFAHKLNGTAGPAGLNVAPRLEAGFKEIVDLSWPVLLLSGILLPMSFGAGWLERLSDFMPIRHVVDAVRSAFFGDFDASMLWGVGWTVVLFGLAVWWGTSVFKKENA